MIVGCDRTLEDEEMESLFSSEERSDKPTVCFANALGMRRGSDRNQYNDNQTPIVPRTMLLLPKLQNLPKTLPLEGAVRIELVEGLPIFRASSTVQNRIEELLEKQQTSPLNSDEEQELDLYEEIDDYFSFINRTVRNLYLTQSQSDV